MTEGETNDDFLHQYSDRLLAIKLNRFEAADLRRALGVRATANEDITARSQLLDEYERLHQTIMDDLSNLSDPKEILKRGIRCLDRVERFRFVVDNLLEAVKRDGSLNNTLKMFQELELLKGSKDATLPEEKRSSPWPWNWSVGSFLRKMMTGLKKLALILFQLVINALKVIPHLAEIEPHVGVSGPFPSLHFKFNLKEKGITVQELFETLSAGLLDEA